MVDFVSSRKETSATVCVLFLLFEVIQNHDPSFAVSCFFFFFSFFCRHAEVAILVSVIMAMSMCVRCIIE